MRILVVEDNASMARLICEVLRDVSYAVDLAEDGRTADEMMSIGDYDLVVLDWQIPEPSGMDLLDMWRQNEITTPVLMLTVRDDVEDRVAGLDAGADDYLTKPFALAELLARVRSLLRRREMPMALAFEAGDVRMEPARRLLTVAGREIPLTPKEFALLEYLLRRKDEVVTRTEIETHVWDSSFDSMTNVVDVTVHRLRRKIDGGRNRRLLQTVRGVGYMMRSERI